MILQNHKIANFVLGIEPASGIGQNKLLNAKQLHHANWNCASLWLPALVQVKTSLHADNFFAAEFTKHEASLVALDGRNGKIWNVLIINRQLVRNLLAKSRKSPM